MGNEAEFHFGKKRSREGLEFVGASKRSRFSQRAAHRPPANTARENSHKPAVAPQPYEQPTTYEQPAIAQIAPEDLIPAQAAEADPLYHIYQEPLLTPTVTNEQSANDVALPYEPSRQSDSNDVHDDHAIKLRDDIPAKPSAFRKSFSYLIAVVSALVLGLSVLYLINHRPVISQQIRKTSGVTIYEVVPNANFKIDKSSVSIAKGGNVVYFVDNTATKAHFIVSQQNVPDIVKDENDYQQFLKDFDKYAEFSSPIGKAYFTKPANIESDVSVVVKTATTLLFIRGPGTTSEADWTQLIGYLRVVK